MWLNMEASLQRVNRTVECLAPNRTASIPPGRTRLQLATLVHPLGAVEGRAAEEGGDESLHRPRTIFARPAMAWSSTIWAASHGVLSYGHFPAWQRPGAILVLPVHLLA